MAVIRIGLVKGSKIARPKNAKSGQVRQLQVQIGEALQTVQLVPQAGEDVNPPDDSIVIIIDSDSLRFAVACSDMIDAGSSVDRGEKKLFSSSGGVIKASIHLKNTGKLTVKNEVQNLASLIGELLDDLVGLQTMGAPPQHVVSPASVTILNALKTKFQALLEV